MPEPGDLLSLFYVKLDGQNAPDALIADLLDVSVESSVHLPDVATLIFHDQHLTWVDDPKLAPGKAVEVSARGESGEVKIFDGEIVELEPEFEPSTIRLKVRAFDRLHRLGRGQKVRTFLNTTDGDLMQRLASEVGLQSASGPSSPVHAYLLQANETDLELLRRRARSLGYLLFVRDRTLHLEPPTAQGSPVELQWGASLREFFPRMTTVDQPAAVSARGWDPEAKQSVLGKPGGARGAPSVGDGRSGGEVAKAAFSLDAAHLVADMPVRTQAEADLLAQAAADFAASRYVEAEGICGGNTAITAGVQIRIANVGERFSGTYFVTSATHTYTPAEGYLTRFGVSGLQPSTLLGVLAPESGRETAFAGLVVGIVTDNQDPNRQGRVKVKYPWLSEEHTSDWARVAAPGAGADRGIQFIPEVNDEVLVGFELGDIRYPYVLGGLWNGVDAPPDPDAVANGSVERRLIRSRSGHTITFDDSGGSGGVTIEDKNGNRVRIDAASGGMTLDVQGDVQLKSSGSMKLEASGTLEIKGASVKVEGSGTVDVKGSMINLN